MRNISKICIASLFLTILSCTDFNYDFSSEEIANAKFEKEYNENFAKEYGSIAPNHMWGFDGANIKQSLTRGGDVSTQYRIVRGTHIENYNWQDENGTWHYDKITWKCDVQHITGGSSDWDERNYAGLNAPNEITDSERSYVFNYLQEHPNQGSTTCELNSYFLQNLGQNYHQYAATKTVNKGTDQERTENVTIDNRHMDNLYFDNVHFQSYNSGIGYDYYVTNTEVINPYYQDTNNGSMAMSNHYRFYYIPSDESNNFEGGCYLCFDYACLNDQNGYYEGDGKYDDWVIKIYPGQSDLFRVFCEDLGSTFDLDFNDLVFDYCDFGNVLSIKVLALEGTLPIYIEDIDLKGSDLTPHHNVTIPQFFVNKNDISDVDIKVETNNHGTCFIANTTGKAPYLLRCPHGTEWASELQRIEEKYPNFIFYASDVTIPWWWNNNN